MREIPTTKLDIKMTSVWRIGGLISTVFAAVVLAGVMAIFYFGAGMLMPWLIIAIAILAAWFIVEVIILPTVRYQRWRFDVTEDDIDIYKGIFIRKRIIIPLVRVQFTDTKQGPIMRSFGLAEVTINTAGGEKTIPGLLVADADALRDKVAKLASLAREEV